MGSGGLGNVKVQEPPGCITSSHAKQREFTLAGHVVPHRVGHIQLRGGCDGEVDAIYGHDLNLFRIKFAWRAACIAVVLPAIEVEAAGRRIRTTGRTNASVGELYLYQLTKMFLPTDWLTVPWRRRPAGAGIPRKSAARSPRKPRMPSKAQGKRPCKGIMCTIALTHSQPA